MSRTNSHSTYGSVTKTFHWVTALLIFAVMPLGIIASRAPTGTEPEIARVFTLFSLHKTIGVTIFFVALLSPQKQSIGSSMDRSCSPL